MYIHIPYQGPNGHNGDPQLAPSALSNELLAQLTPAPIQCETEGETEGDGERRRERLPVGR